MAMLVVWWGNMIHFDFWRPRRGYMRTRRSLTLGIKLGGAESANVVVHLDYYFHFLLVCFMHCLKHLLTLGPVRGFAGFWKHKRLGISVVAGIGCMEPKRLGISVVAGMGVRKPKRLGISVVAGGQTI